MPEAHDFGKNRFLTTLRYPPVKPLPKIEVGVDTREIDEPYRRGYGVVVRIPFSRLGVIVGTWIDKGGPEHQRLQEALQSNSKYFADVEEIAEW